MTGDRPQCPRPLSRRQLLALLGAFGIPGASLAQDARTADPRSYRVVLDNERVRVLEYRSRAGLGVCGQGMHFHPARVTIALTGARYKVTTPEGKVIQREVEPGDVFFGEAVTHSTENIGGTGTRSYIVELKDRDWKPSTG
jgi:hypothetical protein